VTFYARIIAYGFLAIVLCVLFLLPILAFAQIPQEAAKWKRDLIRQSHLAWGLDAPIATIAAQIETESAFNPDAVSPAGARGLAQFIPSTAKWIAGAYPALADNEPSNPIWALRAMATYDRYLWERIVFVATECDHAAFMLSAYNGGEGARDREIDLCLRALTCDSDRWWGHVEKMRWRAPQFFDENRNYTRRILRVREPRYIAAGWGRGLCEEGR
jgi:membrane-bound lytic murein transglycosylase MltF